MFLVCCNKCFSPKSTTNPNKYYLSKCGHIFCQLCLPNGRCRICKAHFIARPIDENMPKSMAEYFEPPEKLFRRFQKILKFQVEQDSLYSNYWVNTVPRQIEEAKKKLNGLMRIEEDLTEKLDEETRRVEKLKKYLAYTKQKNYDSYEDNSIHTQLSGLPTYNMYNIDGQRPKTPTLSTLSNKTMYSTKSSNLSEQSDSFTKRGRVDFSM
ncbi:RING finger protein nenya-like [Eurosta solidaginis]|uniref:RING finger protein nenya-like n=1 Tax=Eurosta solidaginis TaxID=178769 RepID=UPI00353155F4